MRVIFDSRKIYCSINESVTRGRGRFKIVSGTTETRVAASDVARRVETTEKL
jgi:hypothetical protein